MCASSNSICITPSEFNVYLTNCNYFHECRSQREKHVEEYSINGEKVAILAGEDPRSHTLVCLDGTRMFDSPGRFILAEGEEEGNVMPFCAIVHGDLRVGFLATRAIELEEAVICTKVLLMHIML